jgi:hypothetical protein
MTPNEWLLDETRKWFERAQNDLRAAYLTWNQKVFRKTHELRELAAA